MANIVDTVKEQLTFDKVLAAAMRMPGVKIDREAFLQKELERYCPQRVVSEAIRLNPARAGVPKKIVNKISQNVINVEAAKVTAVSLAASIPSSLAAPAVVGAVTADITWYFAHILRVVQELAYLYGFPEFDFSEEGMDTHTMNDIMVFLGVMFGVQGASAALKKLAHYYAEHMVKQLVQRTIARAVIYPVLKRITQKISERLTKLLFADTVASSIPLAGSVLSGGLTLATFKPCCMRLRKTLMTFDLSNPGYYLEAGTDTGSQADAEPETDSGMKPET